VSEQPWGERRLTREEINQLPIRRYAGAVHVVRDRGALRAAAVRLGREKILGFDTETRPAFRKGQHFLPSLVQLASRREVYLFQLRHMGLPRPLRRILADPKITKAGVATDHDVSQLQRIGIFHAAGFVDLGHLARHAGLAHHGLRGLAALFLGIRIPKQAQRSNWSRPELSPAQITYAATDAWAGREIYLRMRKEGLTTTPAAQPERRT